MKRQHISIALFIIGMLFQLSLQWIMHPHAIKGYLYQAWSSEDFMQTVSIDDLRNAPLESLANIHIQPPGYDALRAVLVQFWPSSEIHDALKKVDLTIYFLWTIASSLGIVIIFFWVAEMTNTKLGLGSALFFLLHPGWIYYTTFLDTTLPSALLILWMFYLLWRIQVKETSTIPLIIVLLLLFFTRSLFQWQFIPVIASSLLLLRMPPRKTALILFIVSTVFGLYIVKQKKDFGIASTSSFTGINLTSALSVGDYEHPYAIEDMQEDMDDTLPRVLGRTQKINGTINYNNYQYLWYNKRLTNKAMLFLKKFPVRYLIENTMENLQIYFKPSSQYTTPHIIVDRLPWRNFYDWSFSAPLQPVFLSIAGIISLVKVVKTKKITIGIALLLPAIYIFSLCVLFEKGENNRYKFFLEPVFYVFILTQLFTLYTQIRLRVLFPKRNEK